MPKMVILKMNKLNGSTYLHKIWTRHTNVITNRPKAILRKYFM